MAENKKMDDDDVVDKPDDIKLKRSIGIVTSITILVGSMIGSGIFVSPTGILWNVRSIGATLIIWVACGIFSMLGAYCYAELGTIIERSGGDYIYVYEAFGPFIGFLRLWMEVMVVKPATVAIVALAFGEYVVVPLYPNSFLSFANSFSIKFSTRIQDIFTFAKLAALTMIIITGFVQIGFELKEPFVDSDWSPGKIANAFYSGLFAYGGWNNLNCMVEEMKNPKKHLPIAIVVSCLLVTLFYTAANMAYVTVVPVAEMLTTRAVAVVGRIVFLLVYRFHGTVSPTIALAGEIPVYIALPFRGDSNGYFLLKQRLKSVINKTYYAANVITKKTKRFMPHQKPRSHTPLSSNRDLKIRVCESVPKWPEKQIESNDPIRIEDKYPSSLISKLIIETSHEIDFNSAFVVLYKVQMGKY
ncbi:unnamed protein product [Schistosoma margrebowiei]|uniref:Uncharacterized protein n=1 Tax=Schistosoma margrebowiei TaxID=48269 RepID=A0A183LZQ0_9TREM|nr:unnamed protein product [Schistosoma margrebowiei]